MRLEQLNLRRKKEVTPVQVPQDAHSQHEKVIDCLSNMLPAEELGALRGVIIDQHHQEVERRDTLAIQQPGRDLFAESGVTAAEVLNLQEFLDKEANALPDFFDRKSLKELLDEKRVELAKREQAQKDEARQKEHQDRMRTYAKRRRRKKTAWIAGGVTLAGGLTYGGLALFHEIAANNRAEAIAYEKSHQLNEEPTAYSYTGWRVRNPQLSSETGFEFVPQSEVVLPLVEKNKPLKIIHGDNEINTGIAFDDYETSKGTDVSKVKVALNESDSQFSNGQEELLPEDTTTSPNIIELESQTGEHLLLNMRKATAPGGSDVFVATPVKAKSTR